MNYLSLVQRMISESGVNDTPEISCQSVAGNAGEIRRCCDWVAQSWIEIQEEHPGFDWMRKNFNFNTTANKQSYNLSEIGLTDFSSYRHGSFRIYLTSVGILNEMILTEQNYDSFRDYYLLASRKLSFARPSVISIAPDKSLVLGLPPDDVYTVTGEYFYNPIVLAADTDIPAMPVRFHMAIVYLAMKYYGAFMGAPEVFQRGDTGYAKMMNKIELDQMQPVTTAGSMI